MFCTNCGKKLENKMKYCPDCGCQLIIENEKMTVTENSSSVIKCESDNFSGITKKDKVNKKANKKINKKGVLYALLAISVLLILPNLSLSETEKDNDRTVVQNNVKDDFLCEPTIAPTNTPVLEVKELSGSSVKL